ADLLNRLNKTHKWKPTLTREAMRNYFQYSELITAVATHMELDFKTLDKGLWILAKYEFRGRKNVGDAWVTAELPMRIDLR
ncbi:unnamed protein product, partial [marine sediment metagenome]